MNMITLTGPALVLKSFTVDRSTGSVSIVGRAPGLAAWFLQLIGIDATTELVVTSQEVRLNASSLFGQLSTVTPMKHVALVRAGYAKPVQFLILALVTIYTCILPFVFGALYYLEKRILVQVETTGGAVISIAFKRSIIEGVEVDVENAREVMAIINQHISNANRLGAG